MLWTGALRIKARDIESVRARALAHIASRPRPRVLFDERRGTQRSEFNLVSRARRILRAHVYCARRKEGRGKNTSDVFGQVFVCTAGMLGVPIRLQYRVIN